MLAQGASKVQSYLVSINRLYEDLEYEQALGQIARARHLPRTAAEHVALSLYEGIILAELSRWEESSAAFNAALSLNPVALATTATPATAQERAEASPLRSQVLIPALGGGVLAVAGGTSGRCHAESCRA
jgi:tetratricopeptide (TPR) repeat protein